MKEDWRKRLSKSELHESRTTNKELLKSWGNILPLTCVRMNKLRNPFLDRYVGDTIAQGSYAKYQMNVRGGALSQFPTGLCRSLILFWSDKNDLMFDPCAGRGARALIANLEKRDVVAYDISKRFFRHIVQRIIQLVDSNTSGLRPDKTSYYKLRKDSIEAYLNKHYIQIFRRDSRHVHLADDSVDFVLTSPPYWKIEYYGNEPEQLGWGSDISGSTKHRPTYEQFIDAMKQLLRESLRVLKPDGFAVFNVNDFVVHDTFYAYHIDLYNAAKKVGFIPRQIQIIETHVLPLKAMYLSQLAQEKRLAKNHEYDLIFQKESE
jgi:DNA modification methylase